MGYDHYLAYSPVSNTDSTSLVVKRLGTEDTV